MTEYETTPGTPIPGPVTPPPTPKPDPGAAFGDILESLDTLGRAVTEWAKTTADDPENRRRAREIQNRMEGYGKQIGDAIDGAVKSDVGREVGEAAVKAGGVAVDTAKRLGDEVGPHLVSAFRAAAEGIRRAADSIDERVQEQRRAATPAAPGEHPSPVASPYTGQEPPAPAPHGTPDGHP